MCKIWIVYYDCSRLSFHSTTNVPFELSMMDTSSPGKSGTLLFKFLLAVEENAGYVVTG